MLNSAHSPCRFSNNTCAPKHSLVSLPFALLYNTLSESVVLPCVWLVRFSPSKLIVGLPGSSSLALLTFSSSLLSLRTKLFKLAHDSISVPSAVKCSSLVQPSFLESPYTSTKNNRATSADRTRSAFFQNTL